jgi:hypothetical protein
LRRRLMCRGRCFSGKGPLSIFAVFLQKIH